MSDMDAKLDGGRFAERRWYVDGYASHYFTTKEDAEAAAALARQVALNAEREQASRIRQSLEWLS